MKHARLRVVADNRVRPTADAAVAPVRDARADFLAFMTRVRYWFAFAFMVLGAPFRLVAAVGRFSVAAGWAFFDAIFKIVIGTIGLTLIVVVGYGLLRVILHPLFR